MAFRVVLIESEVSLKLNLNNLVLTKEEHETWVPLDDISMVVIDNLTVNITTRLFCALSEHGIGVVVCNIQHLPTGFYAPMENHSRASKVFRFQIDFMGDPASMLWSKIVSAKILNQQTTLQLLKDQPEICEKMKEFADEITVGDATNREAHAAKIYFNALMGTSFSRGNEDILLNSGLDYGYSIVRAYIARLCVGYGLNTQLGFHHRSEYNFFNLADDIIEPVRPILDFFAYKLLDGEEIFTYEHRRKLVGFLNHKILYCSKKMYICNMLEEYVSQVAGYVMGTRDKILFPQVEDYLGEEEEDEV